MKNFPPRHPGSEVMQVEKELAHLITKTDETLTGIKKFYLQIKLLLIEVKEDQKPCIILVVGVGILAVY